jgi:glucose-6-phosphate 1-dehydrogenase
MGGFSRAILPKSMPNSDVMLKTENARQRYHFVTDQMVEEERVLRAKLKRLAIENHALREAAGKEAEAPLASELSSSTTDHYPELRALESKALSIVVIGASGDLAKKKTYPALFALFRNQLLPAHAIITGYARSKLEQSKFHEQIKGFLKGDDALVSKFLERCTYFSGQYDDAKDFSALHQELLKSEASQGKGPHANRVFYFAIPPSIYLETSKSVKASAFCGTGWNRVVVEKPFGKDLESAKKLADDLLQIFSEEEVYRIDHYLGKEMVQNIMAVRFANAVFEPIWNSEYISSVTLTFKENFGTEGRGGYFDEFGTSPLSSSF